MRRLLLTLMIAASSAAAIASPKSLQELQRLDADSPLAPITAMKLELPDNAAIKMAAMRDAALASGAQHGYAFRLDELKGEIRKQSDALDKLYDFSTLMRLASPKETELYMLPPVIQHARDVTASDVSQRRIRVSNELYVITQPARLVTRPPNWREYLVFDDPRPMSIPNKVLLPKTAEERRYWAAWVAEGWKAGVIQADQEMAARSRSLANDYTGMVRYMRLRIEEKVVAPNVAAVKQPVTGNNKELRLDDRVYELTADAKMNADASKWRALPLDSRDSLLTRDEAAAIDAPAKAAREQEELARSIGAPTPAAPAKQEEPAIRVFGSGKK